jgi:hypothetical protein
MSNDKSNFGLNSAINSSLKKTSPPKNWIHSDDKMLDGVLYNVKVRLVLFNYLMFIILIYLFKYKYVGRVGINESMKSLNFETRTQVARYLS